MARRAEIQVTGLRELRRDLAALDSEGAYKERLKAAGKRVATIVSDEARASAARGATTLSGTRATMGGAAIASIRPLAGQTRATVALGKAALPYAGGWEFGSHGGHRQFPAAKADGYNLYPAIKRKRSEVISAYTREIEALLSDYHL